MVTGHHVEDIIHHAITEHRHANLSIRKLHLDEFTGENTYISQHYNIKLEAIGLRLENGEKLYVDKDHLTLAFKIVRMIVVTITSRETLLN